MHGAAQRGSAFRHRDDLCNIARNVHRIGRAATGPLAHARRQFRIGAEQLFAGTFFKRARIGIIVRPDPGRIAARLNDRDINAMRHQFISHLLAHRFEGEFRRRIEPKAWNDHAPELRANIKDMPAAMRPHARQSGARHTVAAIDIGVKDEFRCGHVLHLNRSTD